MTKHAMLPMLDIDDLCCLIYFDGGVYFSNEDVGSVESYCTGEDPEG